MSTHTAATPSPLLPHARFLVALAAVVMIAVNLWNVGNPILERHGFRQTQTALTSAYMIKDGYRLDYATPVLGEPWSLPFEFPIYQAVVASVTELTGAPLTNVGRIVALLFALGACFPIHGTLQRLGISRESSLLAVAAYLSAPLYLFWSGTFMIESTALFFTLGFLYYAVRVIQGPASPAVAALCALCLAAALLQKVTTVLPPLAIVSLAGAAYAFRARRFMAFAWRWTVIVVPPLVAGYAWVIYSDAVKQAHPIAAGLTSQALSGWNYGTLAQRLSPDFWARVVFGRTMAPASGFVLGLLVVGWAVIRGTPALRMVFLALGALFVLPFLVFTNLHVVHDYYQTANAVFWSLAVGLALGFMLERQVEQHRQGTQRGHAASVLLGAVLVLNYNAFLDSYDTFKFNRIGAGNRTLDIAAFVKAATPPDRPVIWLGFNWSSEAAFYSERRSLTVPGWGDLPRQAITDTRRFLSQPPAAIVNCPNPANSAIGPLLRERHGPPDRVIANCDIFLMRDKAGA